MNTTKLLQWRASEVMHATMHAGLYTAPACQFVCYTLYRVVDHIRSRTPQTTNPKSDSADFANVRLITSVLVHLKILIRTTFMDTTLLTLPTSEQGHAGVTNSSFPFVVNPSEIVLLPNVTNLQSKRGLGSVMNLSCALNC